MAWVGGDPVVQLAVAPPFKALEQPRHPVLVLAHWRSERERDGASRLVQGSAQRAWDESTSLRELIAEVAPDVDLDSTLDYDACLRHLPEGVKRLDALTGGAG